LSKETLGLLNRAYEALNRHDLDSLVATSDPKMEFLPLLLEIGDVTVVHAMSHGHGTESSACTWQRFWQVTEWRTARPSGGTTISARPKP
jgi:hypothetical protein